MLHGLWDRQVRQGDFYSRGSLLGPWSLLPQWRLQRAASRPCSPVAPPPAPSPWISWGLLHFTHLVCPLVFPNLPRGTRPVSPCPLADTPPVIPQEPQVHRLCFTSGGEAGCCPAQPIPAASPSPASPSPAAPGMPFSLYVPQVGGESRLSCRSCSSHKLRWDCSLLGATLVVVVRM